MTVPAADKLRVDYVCDDHTYAELDAFAIRNEAADLFDAIDALHQPDPQTGVCSECAQSDGATTSGYTEGPCDTYRLLHPEEARRER
jgi:hypothetical protein